MKVVENLSRKQKAIGGGWSNCKWVEKKKKKREACESLLVRSVISHLCQIVCFHCVEWVSVIITEEGALHTTINSQAQAKVTVKRLGKNCRLAKSVNWQWRFNGINIECCMSKYKLLNNRNCRDGSLYANIPFISYSFVHWFHTILQQCIP